MQSHITKIITHAIFARDTCKHSTLDIFRSGLYVSFRSATKTFPLRSIPHLRFRVIPFHSVPGPSVFRRSEFETIKVLLRKTKPQAVLSCIQLLKVLCVVRCPGELKNVKFSASSKFLIPKLLTPQASQYPNCKPPQAPVFISGILTYMALLASEFRRL